MCSWPHVHRARSHNAVGSLLPTENTANRYNVSTSRVGDRRRCAPGPSSRPTEPAEPGAPARGLALSSLACSGIADQRALPVEPIRDHLNLSLARGAGDPATADRLETEFGQHPGGRQIVREVCGGESRQPPIGETMPHDSMARFGSVSVPPPRPPEPEAKFSDPGRPTVEAHTANELPVELDAKAHFSADGLKPAHSLSGRERIGDIARHRGDSPIARQPCKLFRIGHAKRAQEESLCLELHHTSRWRALHHA